MRRREFIAGLGGAVAWSVVARGQQLAVSVIGVLTSLALPLPFGSREEAFRQGLGEAGFVEGKNVTLEFRAADGQYDQLPAMAAELVRRRVSVILAVGAPAAVAAKAATSTVPIVFYQGEDPVDLGLVRNLARPEGNITGSVVFSSAVLPKRLEMLHQLAPQARAVTVLVNPSNPNAEISARDARQAASSLGLQIHVVSARSASDLETFFASLGGERPDALLIAPDGLFTAQAARLAALVARYMIPASHEMPDFAAAGGLTSYGGSGTEAARHAGIYVGRVLRGEKPADLPVMRPTKFLMVINLKAARALGLTVPNSLLISADEVIE
jgi:putative ABC transport system substrate-binding protein